MKTQKQLQESAIRKIHKVLTEEEIGSDSIEDAQNKFWKELLILCKQASTSLGDDFVKEKLLSAAKRF